MKAAFDITLVVPKDLVALSNMVSRASLGGGGYHSGSITWGAGGQVTQGGSLGFTTSQHSIRYI